LLHKTSPINLHLFVARAVAVVLAIVMTLSFPGRCDAYAVLSHEAIIDTVWDTNLKPLLVRRFPNATADELRKAHGYSYGGAIIQDMGYYPHGTHFFSDLTHYVRSADFILAMIKDSKDLNDYAFALGAMAHYAADNDGHRIGTNPAVPLLYPKLKKKYGNVVTYEHGGKQYVAVLSGVGGWAGIGLAAGLTDPHAGLGAVGGYAALNNYTALGGTLTVFALPSN